MLSEKQLDKEWLQLMMKAKQMGFSSNEIHTYLKLASSKEIMATEPEK